MDYHRGSLKKHEAIRELILQKPELIGVDKESVIHIETDFLLAYHKRPIAQPDIMIEYSAGGYIKRLFVEIKSGSCKHAIQNLRWQLRKVSRFLRRRHKEGDVLGVYSLGEDLAFLKGY